MMIVIFESLDSNRVRIWSGKAGKLVVLIQTRENPVMTKINSLVRELFFFLKSPGILIFDLQVKSLSSYVSIFRLS